MKRWSVLVALIVTAPLMADELQAYDFKREFFNMLGSLLFVLAFIGITVFFLKRMMRSRLKVLNRSNGIKILERRSLGPKSSLYLVDILGKGVVISESPAGIRTVTEFPVGTDVELLLATEQEAGVASTPPRSIKGFLKKYIKA